MAATPQSSACSCSPAQIAASGWEVCCHLAQPGRAALLAAWATASPCRNPCWEAAVAVFTPPRRGIAAPAGFWTPPLQRKPMRTGSDLLPFFFPCPHEIEDCRGTVPGP
ncbi:MAG: hypothetical protein QOF44_5694 [Streptomyces sp.]|nr:hypothetical protein [Streptomyces sp.]